MYTDLTTRRVLVMEWVDGQRLKGQNRTRKAAQEELKMVEIGVSCSWLVTTQHAAAQLSHVDRCSTE